MQEEAIYRCINPACARLMPRPVKFCPWCGTAQAGVQPPGPSPTPSAGASADHAGKAPADMDAWTRRAVDAMGEPAHGPEREPEREPANVNAAAGRSGWSDTPVPPLSTEQDSDAASTRVPGRDAGGGTAAARAGLAGAGADARAGAREPASAGRARSGWLGTAFGHGAADRATSRPTSRPPPAESVPRPPIPPRPAKPARAPIRLRWWLVLLLILWGVWFVARPNSSKRIEQRIQHAAALAEECEAKQAQDELIALRKTRATPDQLERLQTSLNEGATACARKRQKDKAWNDASTAAEAALAAGNPERASTRLQVYTRRYGDDERARRLRARIEDARHPLAVPPA